MTASLDRTAKVWEAQTGLLKTTMQHDDAVAWGQFSTDGMRLVTACADRSARVWDVPTGEALTAKLLHEGRLFSAEFSPNGALILTSGDDSAVYLRDSRAATSWCCHSYEMVGNVVQPQPGRHSNCYRFARPHRPGLGCENRQPDELDTQAQWPGLVRAVQP